MDVVIIKVESNGTEDVERAVKQLTNEIRKQMKGGRGGGVEVLAAAEMKWKRVEICWGQGSRPAM